MDYETEALLEALGDQVRAQRKFTALNRTELARRTGVSVATLKRVEQGSHATTIGNLAAIASGLDLTLADLVGFTECELGVLDEPTVVDVEFERIERPTKGDMLLFHTRTKLVRLSRGFMHDGEHVTEVELRTPTWADEANAARVACATSAPTLYRLALASECMTRPVGVTVTTLRTMSRLDGHALFNALDQLVGEDLEHAARILRGELTDEEEDRSRALGLALAIHKASGVPWEMLATMSQKERAAMWAAVKSANED